MTATAKHIFWECSAAQRWWSSLTASWSRLGIDLGSDAITWIFGLEMPMAPQQAWNAVAASLYDTNGASDIRQHLLESITVIWRAQVAESIHGIWNERLRQIEDAERDANIGRVITVATHQRVLRGIRALVIQRSNRDAIAADKMTCALVDFLLVQAEPAALLPAPNTDSPSPVFILFFDGGSRGNPGPGGSGSVIVRVSTNNRQATMIWVASMAYGNRQTTNNVAEYRGLVHGLRHAQRHNMTPLHVVGDSSLIINQIRHRRPPLSARLRPLHFQARSTADDIGVPSWAHHYREHNKMADAAANVAMDEGKSQQCEASSHRDILQRIEVHLSNDVSH